MHGSAYRNGIAAHDELQDILFGSGAPIVNLSRLWSMPDMAEGPPKRDSHGSHSYSSSACGWR